MDAVIKVGGSLQADPIALGNLCKTLKEVSSRYNLLIVPGGGHFVELIRKLQMKHGFSDKVAHRVAILGMNIYGLVLHDLIEGSTLTDAYRRRTRGCSIFLPYKTLGRSKKLEPTWKVTSDSIAAWVADKVGCKKLLLVKMVDGILERGRLRRFIPIGRLRKIKQSCVDPKLSQALEHTGITCWVVNGRRPDRVKRILEGGKTICTVISPEASL
jgi:aspartokinase-like uncharacterized kinase